MAQDKIYVTQAVLPPMEEYIEEIKDIWDSHWLTNMGIKHKNFQKALRDYMKIDQIELLVNGHMALEMSIQALRLKGEVITTPFTFASTTHAIIRNGLKPVFCDIDPNDYTIDVNKIEGLITKNTCAILPVHVYGNICNIERIDDIAQKYGLKVIYDAAHTFGETYKGKSIGCYGDVACFSFHATKVFNSIEGGAVCYKDAVIGERLYDLKNFGIHGPEEVSGIGANAKMNEFSAAMGLCNLRHIDREIENRKKVALRYRELLKDIKGIKLNVIQDYVKSNYAYFPIVIDEKQLGIDRNAVCERLERIGIIARKYFYPITNTFSAYEGKYNVMDTPIAYDISKRVITLPIWGGLDMTVIESIADVLRSV